MWIDLLFFVVTAVICTVMAYNNGEKLLLDYVLRLALLGIMVSMVIHLTDLPIWKFMLVVASWGVSMYLFCALGSFLRGSRDFMRGARMDRQGW